MLLAIFQAILRLLSFSFCTRIVKFLSMHHIFLGSVKDTRREVAWAVNAASLRLPGGRWCLPKATAAKVMLSRRGISARLRIGVARTQDRALDAHAWLEDDEGMIVGQLPGPERFETLENPLGNSDDHDWIHFS